MKFSPLAFGDEESRKSSIAPQAARVHQMIDLRLCDQELPDRRPEAARRPQRAGIRDALFGLDVATLVTVLVPRSTDDGFFARRGFNDGKLFPAVRGHESRRRGTVSPLERGRS